MQTPQQPMSAQSSPAIQTQQLGQTPQPQGQAQPGQQPPQPGQAQRPTSIALPPNNVQQLLSQVQQYRAQAQAVGPQTPQGQQFLNLAERFRQELIRVQQTAQSQVPGQQPQQQQQQQQRPVGAGTPPVPQQGQPVPLNAAALVSRLTPEQRNTFMAQPKVQEAFRTTESFKAKIAQLHQQLQNASLSPEERDKIQKEERKYHEYYTQYQRAIVNTMVQQGLAPRNFSSGPPPGQQGMPGQPSAASQAQVGTPQPPRPVSTQPNPPMVGTPQQIPPQQPPQMQPPGTGVIPQNNLQTPVMNRTNSNSPVPLNPAAQMTPQQIQMQPVQVGPQSGPRPPAQQQQAAAARQNTPTITFNSLPAIPSTLNIKPTQAAVVPPARPTLTGGYATGNAMTATPALARPPQYELEDGHRLLSKRKLQELVRQIYPDERLEPEVEDLLLEVADEFVESVAGFACRLAKHRKSDTLDVKDVQFHLEKNYNIRVPGFAMDEIRSVRKNQPTPGYQQKASRAGK
ncbi:Transcription initiation factor TFIID subunit 12 [Saitoella coloradoensis]